MSMYVCSVDCTMSNRVGKRTRESFCFWGSFQVEVECVWGSEQSRGVYFLFVLEFYKDRHDLDRMLMLWYFGL